MSARSKDAANHNDEECEKLDANETNIGVQDQQPLAQHQNTIGQNPTESSTVIPIPEPKLDTVAVNDAPIIVGEMPR